MKKKAILGIGLSVLATAAAGVALFQWVAQPRYQLGDIYERYYVVENTPVEIEPVTIDLTEYAGAGEDAWENADVPLYSDPHCEIRMTTVRPDGDGTYEVYFLVTNHLEEASILPHRSAVFSMKRETINRNSPDGSRWRPTRAGCPAFGAHQADSMR